MKIAFIPIHHRLESTCENILRRTQVEFCISPTAVTVSGIREPRTRITT